MENQIELQFQNIQKFAKVFETIKTTFDKEFVWIEIQVLQGHMVWDWLVSTMRLFHQPTWIYKRQPVITSERNTIERSIYMMRHFEMLEELSNPIQHRDINYQPIKEENLPNSTISY